MKHTSISINDELEARIKPLLKGSQSYSQFVYNATEERVKRLEKRDERSKDQLLQKNANQLIPVLEVALKKMGVVK